MMTKGDHKGCQYCGWEPQSIERDPDPRGDTGDWNVRVRMHEILCRFGPKKLNAACDNIIAWQLGQVALEAGNPTRTDVGDPIDRGLILLRLLREAGFEVRQVPSLSPLVVEVNQ